MILKKEVFNKRGKTIVVLLFLSLIICKTFSQNVGINANAASPDASAMLDIVSTNKGLLIPRVALTGTTDVATIASAATSLLVYNTATAGDVTPGYYYWTGSVWLRFVFTTPASANWSITANAGTNASTNFVGNIDNIDLTFRTNNIERMKIKNQSLEILNTSRSVYIGDGAGANMLTTGNRYNIALGYQALNTATTATDNIAVGYRALYTANSSNCIAIGNYSQYSNSSGTQNISVGQYAMYNTTAGKNLAFGDSALYTNTTGIENIAIGNGALRAGANPNNNIAFGRYALLNASGASGHNIGIGLYAGKSISSGVRNIAIGNYALHSNTTANDNVAIGYEAGYTSNTGTNTLIGNYAGRAIAGSGNVCIGYSAGYNEAGSDKLYIDNSNTATPLIYGDFSNNWVGIDRVPTTNAFEISGGASKAVAAAWLANSDRRIKTDIQDVENAIETIMKLRPVKFKYTDEWKNRTPYIKEHDHYYYNFIAQEYQKIFPESVQGSGEYLEGDSLEILQIDTYSSQIVAIKALQEQQLIIEQQKAQIDQQQKEIEEQNKSLIEQKKKRQDLMEQISNIQSNDINIKEE